MRSTDPRRLDGLEQIRGRSVRRFRTLTTPSRPSGRQTFDGNENERGFAREGCDQVELPERLSVVDDDDARLVEDIEQALCLARQHDRAGCVEASVMTGDPEQGAEMRLGQCGEIGRSRGRA